MRYCKFNFFRLSSLAACAWLPVIDRLFGSNDLSTINRMVVTIVDKHKVPFDRKGLAPRRSLKNTRIVRFINWQIGQRLAEQRQPEDVRCQHLLPFTAKGQKLYARSKVKMLHDELLADVGGEAPAIIQRVLPPQPIAIEGR